MIDSLFVKQDFCVRCVDAWNSIPIAVRKILKLLVLLNLLLIQLIYRVFWLVHNLFQSCYTTLCALEVCPVFT